MLTPAFAGELFGKDQPLDARKYFVIIPDSVGHGKSAKPSDGMKAKFPHYNYDDMVEAQHRLLTEALGVKHVRLIIGNSMGGMHAWLWGEKYPGYMDALVPMASQPTAMAARNWMLRRFMIQTIWRDPEYANGDYTTQPASAKVAAQFYATATNGGTLDYQKLAPNGALADKAVEERLAAPFNADANDFVYAWESSKGYDPEPTLNTITASVLCINAADDERNPPETGVTEAALNHVKDAKLLLIPRASTRGHGTTGAAKWYARELGELLQSGQSARCDASVQFDIHLTHDAGVFLGIGMRERRKAFRRPADRLGRSLEQGIAGRLIGERPVAFGIQARHDGRRRAERREHRKPGFERNAG